MHAIGISDAIMRSSVHATRLGAQMEIVRENGCTLARHSYELLRQGDTASEIYVADDEKRRNFLDAKSTPLPRDVMCVVSS